MNNLPRSAKPRVARWKWLVFFLMGAHLCAHIALSQGKSHVGISPNEARRLISRFAGASLSKKSIQIEQITPGASSKATVTAKVKVAFRIVGDENHSWRVAEIRAGDNQWEDVFAAPVAADGKSSLAPCESQEIRPPTSGKSHESEEEAAAKYKARCAISRFLGEGQESEAINIKEVSPLEIQFSSRPSAVVEAQLLVEFALDRSATGAWRISELRTGDGKWRSLDPILQSLRARKIVRARTELQEVAAALESFRRERGFYVVSKSDAVLIDQLTPLYLKDVIRVDPWHHAYQYRGAEDHFMLRSAGPDGKFDTEDDLLVEGEGHSRTR